MKDNKDGIQKEEGIIIKSNSATIMNSIIVAKDYASGLIINNCNLNMFNTTIIWQGEHKEFSDPIPVGIYIMDSTGTMKKIKIDNTNYGIFAINSSLIIENCSFEDDMVISGEGNYNIKNNIINNCETGIIITGSNCNIINNTISNNKIGIYTQGANNILIRDNKIVSNTEHGLQITVNCYEIFVYYNLIENNGFYQEKSAFDYGGIKTYSIYDIHNYVKYNMQDIKINYNVIQNNKDFAIEGVENSDILINAEFNYYGTTNEDLISNMMIGNIDYYPWLTEPPF